MESLAVIVHTAAQSKTKAELMEASAHRMWFFLAGVIGVCTVVNWTSKAVNHFSSHRGHNADVEGSGSAAPRKASAGRIPSAVAATLKVIAFRCSVPTGFGTVLFSEVGFIAAYMAVTFALLFMKSESSALHGLGMVVLFSYRSRQCATLVVHGSRSADGLYPTSLHCGVGGQEQHPFLPHRS
jgi:hypothetical protein